MSSIVVNITTGFQPVARACAVWVEKFAAGSHIAALTRGFVASGLARPACARAGKARQA
jgi:hypothetical protein